MIKKGITILVIQPSNFPPKTGDSANYMEQIFALKRRGLKIVLICLKNSETKKFNDVMAKNEISVFSIPFNPPHLQEVNDKGIGFSTFLTLLLFYIAEIFTVLRAFTKYPVKFCMIRHSILTIPLSPLLKTLRIRSIADGEILSYYLEDAMTIKKSFLKILFPIERKVLEMYSFFKVTTRSQMNMMLNLGFHQDQLIMSRVGVSLSDVPIYNLKDIPPATFGFFGSLEKYQGLDYLIRCFAKVIEKKNNVKLYIIGNGSMKKELIKSSEKLGINGSIIFKDTVPRKVLWDKYFRLFRVTIIPRKPLRVPVSPIKLAEALASGKPVIATSVEGIREVVGGGVILIQPGNEDEMSDAIISLCENETFILEMSHKALESAKQFDVDDQVGKILQVLV